MSIWRDASPVIVIALSAVNVYWYFHSHEPFNLAVAVFCFGLGLIMGHS